MLNIFQFYSFLSILMASLSSLFIWFTLDCSSPWNCHKSTLQSFNYSAEPFPWNVPVSSLHGNNVEGSTPTYINANQFLFKWKSFCRPPCPRKSNWKIMDDDGCALWGLPTFTQLSSLWNVQRCCPSSEVLNSCLCLRVRPQGADLSVQLWHPSPEIPSLLYLSCAAICFLLSHHWFIYLLISSSRLHISWRQGLVTDLTQVWCST